MRTMWWYDHPECPDLSSGRMPGLWWNVTIQFAPHCPTLSPVHLSHIAPLCPCHGMSLFVVVCGGEGLSQFGRVCGYASIHTIVGHIWQRFAPFAHVCAMSDLTRGW